MLTWEQIEREVHDHLEGVTAAPPWLHSGLHALPVAMRRAVWRGREAIKLIAFICPEARMRFAMALAIGDRLETELALLQKEHCVQFVLPVEGLTWEGLRRAIEHLLVNARFARQDARSRAAELRTW